jgi:ABC-type phosphonate transport system ATPase subunit
LRKTLVICIAASIVLSACATVVPLTDGGARVREITAAQATQCTFLRTVSFTDALAGAGKSWGLVHQDGENGIRDDVAAYGGNAYISRQADADWFWGHVNYTAEAYRCP